NGLYSCRARYYSPTFGRFVSEDPIGFAGGVNVYAYAAGSPTNLTDPSGHSPALGAAAATVATQAGLGAAFGAAVETGSTAGPVGAVIAGGVAAGVYDYYAGREYCTASGWSWCSNPLPQPQLGPLPVNPPGTSRGTWPKYPADMAGRKPTKPGNNNNDDDNCAEQWEWATRQCHKLLSLPNPPRAGGGQTGGYTDVANCARGYVTQRCGGNRTD